MFALVMPVPEIRVKKEAEWNNEKCVEFRGKRPKSIPVSLSGFK